MLRTRFASMTINASRFAFFVRRLSHDYSHPYVQINRPAYEALAAVGKHFTSISPKLRALVDCAYRRSTVACIASTCTRGKRGAWRKSAAARLFAGLVRMPLL